MIYRHVLDIQSKETRWEYVVESLRQPALTRVSKQIRDETLPIFYGENEFVVDVPGAIGRWNHTDDWHTFPQMFECFDQSASLQHVVEITVHYHEPVPDDMCAYQFGFRAHNPEHCDSKLLLLPNERIGDNDLDWNDKTAVKKAVRKTLTSTWHDLDRLQKHVPIHRVVNALCITAKKCPEAFKWVEVYFDWR